MPRPGPRKVPVPFRAHPDTAAAVGTAAARADVDRSEWLRAALELALSRPDLLTEHLPGPPSPAVAAPRARAATTRARHADPLDDIA